MTSRIILSSNSPSVVDQLNVSPRRFAARHEIYLMTLGELIDGITRWVIFYSNSNNDPTRNYLVKEKSSHGTHTCANSMTR